MSNRHNRHTAAGDPGLAVAEPGQHVWAVNAMFRVDPATGSPTLTREQLINITAPSCLYCNEQYHPIAAARACRATLRSAPAEGLNVSLFNAPTRRSRRIQ